MMHPASCVPRSQLGEKAKYSFYSDKARSSIKALAASRCDAIRSARHNFPRTLLVVSHSRAHRVHRDLARCQVINTRQVRAKTRGQTTSIYRHKNIDRRFYSRTALLSVDVRRVASRRASDARWGFSRGETAFSF